MKGVGRGMFYFLKALRVFAIVSLWSEKALEDGKVTAQEAADLGIQIAGALDLPTEIDVGALPPGLEKGKKL